MKWLAGIALAVLAGLAVPSLLAKWALSGAAPWIVAASYDGWTRIWRGEDPYTRCLTRETTPSGTPVIGTIPDRQCFAFDPPRSFTGIYIDEFEGQQFIEGGNPRPPYRSRSEEVWLHFDNKSRLGPLSRNLDGPTRIWLVTIMGSKTSERGRYGHMGVSDHEIVVDQVLTARPLATYQGYAPQDVVIRR